MHENAAPAPLATPITATVRDLRRDRAYAPGGDRFPALVTALLPIGHGVAESLLPERPDVALLVTEAVWRSFALHWRRLPRKTPLASYLVRTAVLLANRERRRLRLLEPPPDSAGAGWLPLFRTLTRMRGLRFDVMVLRYVLRQSQEETSRALRISSKKTAKYSKRGLAKLTNVCAKRGISTSPEPLLGTIGNPVPAELEIRVLTEASPGVKGKNELVGAALRAWRWIAWRQFLRRAFVVFGVFCAVLVLLAGTAAWLARQGYLTAWFLRNMNRQLAKEIPQLAVPARPWPVTSEERLRAEQRPSPKNSVELYELTNIWTCDLAFTASHWKALQPTHVPPSPMTTPDGTMMLRNPKARRSGLAGVIGLEFNWTEGVMNFASAHFDKVAIRYRGNGTYVNSLFGPKQSLKVDLSKYGKGQELAGVHTLNLVNAIPDNTYLRDALAERLFRDLGVPGPRVGYVYLTLDVPGKFAHQPLGLYVLIENIDADFARDRFGTRKVPIFKPVTNQLFDDLGSNWTNYAAVYDLKTKATPEQRQRLIDFARLASHGSDTEFANHLSEFLDLDEFAGFLAGHVLLSSYDGFLTNGQNYYLYLDPRSNRFVLIPWDQDHSWGEFGYVATADQREHASVWQPSTYEHRFLNRVLRVELFRSKYRQALERALQDLFTPERLGAQVDQLAAVIRPAIAAESEFRLQRFDLAVSTNWLTGPRDGAPEGPKAPVHQIKRFIVNRSVAIREQLDGKATGVVLARHNGPK